MISRVEWNFPAQHSGLIARDKILSIDGIWVTERTLDQILGSKKPGDRIQTLISRRNAIQEVEVTLGKKKEKGFNIRPVENPDLLQLTILEEWLKEQ